MHENGRGMQNPGDLRVPEGVVVEPARAVLVVGNGAVRIDPSKFDEVAPLYSNGGQPTAEDEKLELELTTRR